MFSTSTNEIVGFVNCERVMHIMHTVDDALDAHLIDKHDMCVRRSYHRNPKTEHHETKLGLFYRLVGFCFEQGSGKARTAHSLTECETDLLLKFFSYVLKIYNPSYAPV